MYEILKKMILNKTESNAQIKSKLDIFIKTHRLTKEEYNELLELLEKY